MENENGNGKKQHGSGSKCLENFTVLNEVHYLASRITPDMLDYVGRHLESAGDAEVIGTVDDPDLKSMYALHFQLTATAKMEVIKSTTVLSDADSAGCVKAAIKSVSLAELAHELFWAQFRTDSDLWEPCSLSVREGWRVIDPEAEKSQGPEGTGH